MTKQKTPHTQTQQNTNPEQTDLENDQTGFEADDAYSRMDGAETGLDKSPRKLDTRAPRHRTEPEGVAHEGAVTSRVSKKPVQGITSHSAREEGARQAKVVRKRPDARAGTRHSK